MLEPGPKRRDDYDLVPWESDPVEWYEKITNRKLYRWQAEELRKLLVKDRPAVAYCQVARKQGKSALGAALAICEAARPQRHIYVIADSERNLQSSLFREIRDTINASTELSGGFVQFQNKIEVPSTGSFIETRPNNFRASQSINPHVVIFDELHLQKNSDTFHGMRLAGSARDDGILFAITTPGYDLNSPAHTIYQAIKAGNTDVYGKIYEPADQQCALDDREAWLQANPRLVDDPGFMKRLEADFKELPEHEFRRFRLGLWTSTSEQWLPVGAWDTCAIRRGQPEIGTRVVLGFDGSFSGDSTALVGATVGEEHPYVFVCGVWENPGKDGWRVPRDAVHAAVANAFHRYKVEAMYVDPPYWQREIEEWEALYGSDKILELPTGSAARIAPLCTTFYSGVMEHHLSHDGDQRLARHLNNCITKATMHGDVITKPDRNSPAKIDLAVAAVLAYGHAVLGNDPPPQFQVW